MIQAALNVVWESKTHLPEAGRLERVPSCGQNVWTKGHESVHYACTYIPEYMYCSTSAKLYAIMYRLLGGCFVQIVHDNFID